MCLFGIPQGTALGPYLFYKTITRNLKQFSVFVAAYNCSSPKNNISLLMINVKNSVVFLNL